MCKLYIHIGRPKTGTTAIQKYLAEHREELMGQRVLYPNCMIFDDAHHLLPIALLEDIPDVIQHIPKIKLSELKHDFDQEVERLKPDVIILSSEFFSLMTPPARLECRETLKDFFSGYTVKIISYFREQVSYLESSYSQEVRNYGMSRDIRFDEFCSEYLKRKVNDYNYSIQQWENVFGSENTIGRAFERSQLVNEDAVEDLLYCVGVDTQTLPQVDGIKNPAMSHYRIELVNRIVRSRGFTFFRKHIYNAIANTGAVESEQVRYSFLSQQEADDITLMYREGNRSLAERKGARCSSFFENFQRVMPQKYPGLGRQFATEFSGNLVAEFPDEAQLLYWSLKTTEDQVLHMFTAALGEHLATRPLGALKTVLKLARYGMLRIGGL